MGEEEEDGRVAPPQDLFEEVRSRLRARLHAPPHRHAHSRTISLTRHHPREPFETVSIQKGVVHQSLVRPQKGPTGSGRPSLSGPRKGCQEGKGGEGRRACSATRAETWGEGGEEEGEERGEGGGDGASEKVTLSMPSMRTGSRALESADRSSVHGRWRRERIPILFLLLFSAMVQGLGVSRARVHPKASPPPSRK